MSVKFNFNSGTRYINILYQQYKIIKVIRHFESYQIDNKVVLWTFVIKIWAVTAIYFRKLSYVITNGKYCYIVIS